MLSFARCLTLVALSILYLSKPSLQWSSSMSTLADRLMFQYRSDPEAKVDSYAALTDHQKADLFSTDDGTTLASKVTQRRANPQRRSLPSRLNLFPHSNTNS